MMTSNNDATCTKDTVTLPPFIRPDVIKEINKQVLRKKLAKQRHLVLQKVIDPSFLDTLFPSLLRNFRPQQVTYNGGIAQIKQWKISCYLEVMQGGVPCTDPNETLLKVFRPVLEACNALFLYWYRQQHACNQQQHQIRNCHRLMTFITRYTHNPGEQALLKVRV